MSTQTPLHLAAAQSRHEVCRMLLRAGAEVDAKDGFDCTPLAAAMLTYSLIQARAVNFSSAAKRSAAICGLSKTVAVLQQHGAQLDLVTNSEHGGFSAPVNNWVQEIEAQWRSEQLTSQLERSTPPAIGSSRPQRL